MKLSNGCYTDLGCYGDICGDASVNIFKYWVGSESSVLLLTAYSSFYKNLFYE